MKKNFNEILQREDYVRLTANLKERTEEIAQLIKSKMVQLDLEAHHAKSYKGIVLDSLPTRGGAITQEEKNRL